MIYVAFFAGMILGAIGVLAYLMIGGAPEDYRRTPRLSTIINTALVKKMQDEKKP